MDSKGGGRKLTNLPALGINAILDKLGMRSIISLQKTCTTFRTYVDFAKPSFHITEIAVEFQPSNVILSMTTASEWSIRVNYENNVVGCIVSCGTNRKILDGADYLEVFCRDMKQLLEHQKSKVQCFRLYGKSISELFKNILKSYKLKSHKLDIHLWSQEEVMEVLQYFDAATLKEIRLFKWDRWDEKEIWNHNEIVDFGFWKKLESLTVTGYKFDLPLKEFFHLPNGDVSILKVSSEELFEMRNLIVTRPTFDCFFLHYDVITNPIYFPRFMGISRQGRLLQVDDGMHFNFPNTDKILIYVVYCLTMTKFGMLDISDEKH